MDANVLGLGAKNALVVGGGFGMGRETVMRTAVANQSCMPLRGCWPRQSFGMSLMAATVGRS